MSSLCLNAAEREALRELPHLSRLIYLLGLRPFMDYGTGIVGLLRGVSWKSIAEELYVEPHQGIKGGEPSEKALRRALVWLQKAGLLSANRDGKKRLIFECLLATRDNCARNKVGRSNQGQAGSLQQTLNTSPHAAFNHNGDNQVAGSKTPKVGTPPAFNLSNCLTSSSPAAQPEGEAVEQSSPQAGADEASPVNPALVTFSMSFDWQPERSSLEAIASALGVPLDGLTAECLADWRVFWAIKHPERKQTQQQWELQLVNRLKHVAIEAAEQAQRAEAKAKQAQSVEPSPSGVKPEKVRQKTSSKVVPLRAMPPAPIPENPKQQEPIMPSAQTNELLSLLWQEMHDLYGWKFKSQFGKQPSPAWGRALGDLDSSQIMTGLRNLIASVDQTAATDKEAWPPSALEFRHLCLQIPGLPSIDKAWFEAVSGTYSHEAVQYAAKLSGLGALKNVKSGHLDRHQERTLRGCFEMNFQRLKERLQRGEPLQGRQVAAQEGKQKLQEAYGEYQRLIQHIQAGEAPTASNALRQQAVQARREAQALGEQFGFPALPAAPVVADSTNVQSLRQGRGRCA